MNGEAIGISHAIYTTQQEGMFGGVAFAIPIDQARELLAGAARELPR
jgi:hypothetical protein